MGGFTAVELIITMAVLAILVAAAVPSLQTMIRRNGVASEANRIVASLQQARTLAIAGGPIAGICVAAPTTPCAGGTARNYGGGFMVVTSASPLVAAFIAVPVTYNEANSNVRILTTSSTAAGNRVLFDRLGRLAEATLVTDGVAFTICWDGVSTAGIPGVRISVNPSGRVQSEEIPPTPACRQNTTALTS